nr:immunoglobulin light chain junction region [Macaca mulatta]MOW43278.1 immunoglobulin light chain junction region [Macaca mulatta]MOW44808.1 immunoglobulin light chain junction region [Macaca mulatta]
CMQDLDFPFTF